ncbi:hypothetical protein [Flavobacterium sp. FlaQc-48]|uniref:hypothetical protein n=1 Tax=Flavobacterium sp. FlaQc-48 TaxID=3374181 RepID=UPI0037579856
MNLLDLQTYYFELPLYAKVQYSENEEDKIFGLMWSEIGINAYNPTIRENTTYFIVIPKSKHFLLSIYNGRIVTDLYCSRTKEIVTVISFLDTKTKTIQKIGQHPSIAHFHIAKIKDYQKVLNPEKIKEFTRAIGLASNGVGIGSFVYLRRIFEHLLENEHQKAKLADDWNDELYVRSKVVEKIELLKNNLPSFLVENKTLYGILSVGIHSLEENECLQYFETVKIGIELILDEELEKYRKEQKILDAKKKIGIVNQQIKNKKE